MPPKRKKLTKSCSTNVNTNVSINETVSLKECENNTLTKQFNYEKKTPLKLEFEKTSPEKAVLGIWRPAYWEEFMKNLRQMRINQDAPVDTMGCHKCPDTEVPPKVFRYQSLISLMLSSQTKDQVTFAAMERLKARGLTVDKVLEMPEQELGELIKPVGFWRTKAKYIKKTTQILKDQYDGDIPDSVQKMCKLVGVGPKMAHICMSVAWNTVSGIGVDTHVHRICNRIGWVRKPTATPEGTRKSLESWLPNEEWGNVNHLLVGFGQTICTPVNPKCLECLNKHICLYKGKVRKSPLKQPNIEQEKNNVSLISDDSKKYGNLPKMETVKQETDTEENNLFDELQKNCEKKNSKKLELAEKVDIKKSPTKRKLSPIKKLEKDKIKVLKE